MLQVLPHFSFSKLVPRIHAYNLYIAYIYTSRCHSELHTNEVNACIEPKTLKPKDENERVTFPPCASFIWLVISNAALDLQMCRKMLKEPGKHADRQTDRQIQWSIRPHCADLKRPTNQGNEISFISRRFFRYRVHFLRSYWNVELGCR